MEKNRLVFPRRLPHSRLGEKHTSLNSFNRVTEQDGQTVRKSEEYSLVVLTETTTQIEKSLSEDNVNITDDICKLYQLGRGQSTSILLAMNNRDYDRGFHTLFGGKFIDVNETAESCACRELEEKINLKIHLDDMAKSKVGIQRYTIENEAVVMIMHVFRIKLEKISGTKIDQNLMMGSDKLIPVWYNDINKIPLDNMFADNSLWLTALLSSSKSVQINGSYHFQRKIQDTNTILHYYLDIQPKKTDFSMEQRLFHTLHENQSNLLSIKEFKECYAFCNAIRQAFSKTKRKNNTFDIVIDVCGGHGALAALFLICTTASFAIVIDPANVGGGKIQEVWGSEFISKDKKLKYRRECLRTGLPDELRQALKMTTRHRILVVACHACQHLSEEILEIACHHGVNVAVMPCCQKDRSPGSTWKAASKNLSVPVAKVIDILQCGKLMALGSHMIRLKCIDSRITPQNRIIGEFFTILIFFVAQYDVHLHFGIPFLPKLQLLVCRALSENEIFKFRKHEQNEIDKAHSKLELVYRKAHGVPGSRYEMKSILNFKNFVLPSSIIYLAAGFVAGVVSARTFRKP